MDKYIGRLLDNRYEILEVLGVGGMAVVYKAKCHRLNRMVAIKILKDDFLEDEEFRDRFHAEGQAVARLSHPNIVSVYDVSTTAGCDYIVMELIEGITLKQYIEKKGILNWKETLHFAAQIAKALDHAHSHDIVHRDIKPHNIMVLRNGSVKVADFGIARSITKGNTLQKEALGSVHYISPEQARGEHVDARSDIYSLGVVMYEMATGKQPYVGSSPVNVALQHINGGAVLPSNLNKSIPHGFEQIIMKAMAQDPADRYHSTVELQEAIEQFQKNPDMVFPYPMPVVASRRRSAGNRARVIKMQTGEQEESRSRRHVELPEDGRKAKKPNPREEKNSKVATIAIIVCSVTIVIAIAVLAMLMVNNPFDDGTKMVRVPDLVGKTYATLPSYSGLTISKQEEVFSDTVPSGKIISQSVAARTEVPRGTTIYLTVSKGVEPKFYYMPEVTGMVEAEAYSALEAIGISLTYEIKYEVSETVKAGRVLRSEPTVGTELKPGNKIVLYVAKAKTAVKEVVPGVVSKNVNDAIKILNNNKFENIKVQYVIHPTIEAGIVISQSVSKGTKMDISRLITIVVSCGPTATEPPTEPPSLPAEPTIPGGIG